MAYRPDQRQMLTSMRRRNTREVERGNNPPLQTKENGYPRRLLSYPDNFNLSRRGRISREELAQFGFTYPTNQSRPNGAPLTVKCEYCDLEYCPDNGAVGDALKGN